MVYDQGEMGARREAHRSWAHLLLRLEALRLRRAREFNEWVWRTLVLSGYLLVAHLRHACLWNGCQAAAKVRHKGEALGGKSRLMAKAKAGPKSKEVEVWRLCTQEWDNAHHWEVVVIRQCG